MLRTILVLTTMVILSNSASAQYEIDYEYAPPYWLTTIGFVDDWQKSLVDKNGSLAYDFGPGPYVRPKTSVSVRVAGSDPEEESASQFMYDARVPLVLTNIEAADYRLSQIAFSLVPDEFSIPSGISADGSYVRTNGLAGTIAWAPAEDGIDEAFRSVAWGTGRSINYRIRVEKGSRKKIALGFSDIYRSGRISRGMDINVDGVKTFTIDLLKSAEQGTPQVFFFNGVDHDSDGWIEIDIGGSFEALDPNTFLNGIWVFDSQIQITDEEVISGDATDKAELKINCGALYMDVARLRQDALRTTLHGDGQLEVEVKTVRPVEVDLGRAVVTFEGEPFVETSPVFTEVERTDGGLLLKYPVGTKSVDVVVSNGRSKSASTFPELSTEQGKAVTHWNNTDLPYGRLQVPDAELQRLLDGSIRTLYQIRDVVDGYAQFQPGPSVYRGLWYVDTAWAIETATFLGDYEAAEASIGAMILHQEESGRAGVIKPALLHRETAHLVYIICRYARLTQNWEWLDNNWESLTKAMDYIMYLRDVASEDPDALSYGLMPPGLTDGGIGGVGSTYGSTYWALIAVAEAVRTVNQLQKPEAEAWNAEYQDFLAAFRRAQERDQRRDENGNLYLPLKMDFDPEVDTPQRGQWGPIHSLYAGQFLDPDEPLVKGTLAMLENRTIEDHVHSLGWLDGGIWPIFEAHRAIVYNFIREPDKAERLLYSFANHASPTYVWVEEQMPKGKGTRTTGDVPHTMGNLQVVRLIRFLLLTERGDDLELLNGLPQTWLKPGSEVRALDVATLFGKASVIVTIAKDGMTGKIWVQTPASGSAGVTRVDLRRLKAAGFRNDLSGVELSDTIELGWGQTTEIHFSR